MKRIDYKEVALQLIADKCRASFFYYLQTFWNTIIPEKPVYNWHIKYLCDELQKVAVNLVARKKKLYDILINIPPGTTKTTIATVMFPTWIWTIDPTIKIISNSYSNDLATEHAFLARDVLLSHKYKTLFPEIKIRRDKSGKSAYANTLNGSRNTTSTGGTITGKHAHLIINDDPLNPKQADSEVLRKEANKHTGTLSSRKTDKEIAVTITIMQRLHEDDVSGGLLKRRGGDSLFHICLPAEVSNNVQPAELKEFYVDGFLDPKRLGRSVLDEAKRDLGSMAYSGQYDQDPVVEGGNIVKSEWFGKISYDDFNALYVRSYPTVHFFVDTAFTENNQNDPTGVISATYIEETLYIISGKKVRMEFPDLTKFLPTWVKSNRYSPKSTVRIEPKANGISVIQQLKRDTKLNVTNTPSPTDSKMVRMQANTGIVECGKVVLVEGDWTEDFVEEVAGFPTKTHDEYVDLLNYAIDYFVTDYKAVDDNIILNSFR